MILEGIIMGMDTTIPIWKKADTVEIIMKTKRESKRGG